MSPERWKKVEAIFNAALVFDPAERDDFVRRACADDRELAAEVRSMLANDESSESFFGSGVFGLLEPEGDDSAGADENIDRQLGAYRLVKQLGRGGMGAVYLAERADGEFRQQVAVKLIKSGMDTDLVLKRFRHERQILADLNHPYIARLLDGGTIDSMPYFVMEFVDGQSILDYCSEHRLPIRERLLLFLQVCSAVRAAHQKTIIHCDIKPGNILVTNDGTVKLLDFGIAKILDDEETREITTPTLRLLTPDYASPEHVRGLPISEASDIYSLGILLYELLTDHHPYRSRFQLPDESPAAGKSEPAESPSRIIFAEQNNPSTRKDKIILSPEMISSRRKTTPRDLHEALKGDLDAIALRAINENPGLRFRSTDHLIREIERYLQGTKLISDGLELSPPVADSKKEPEYLERHLEEEKDSLQAVRLLSPRQKGVRQGAVLAMSGIIGTPLVMLLSLEFGLKPTWTLIFAFLTIIGGIMRLAYALIFEDRLPAGFLPGNRQKPALDEREKEIPALDNHSVPPGSWMDDVDYSDEGRKATRFQKKSDRFKSH